MADWNEGRWNLDLQPLKMSGWCISTNKGTWPVDHVVLRDHMTNQNNYNSTIRLAMTTKLGSLVGRSPWWASTHKVACSVDHVILQGHLTNKNYFLSTTRVPMATKIDRLMTYLDGLLPIKSQNLLITWPCEINKLKQLYVQYHSPYGQQTWKGIDITWRAPNENVLWGHVTY